MLTSMFTFLRMVLGRKGGHSRSPEGKGGGWTAKVIVYSTNPCSYCVMAKQFLKKKGVKFEEKMVFGGTPDWDEMRDLTKGRTVPQILIDGRAIGGLPDLLRLEDSGELDSLLGGA